MGRAIAAVAGALVLCACVPAEPLEIDATVCDDYHVTCNDTVPVEIEGM